MSNFWKGVALTIILFFVLILIYNLFNRAGTSETDKSSYNQQVDTYYNFLEDQDKRNLEYYKKADAQILLVNEINDKNMKNQERFERLLDRWEKQADKMDKILLKLDK